MQGQAELVKNLLEHDQQLVEIPMITGETPLYVAVQSGQTSIVRLLLDFGADVENAPHNTPTKTPLALAQEKGLKEIVSLLKKGERS